MMVAAISCWAVLFAVDGSQGVHGARRGMRSAKPRPDEDRLTMAKSPTPAAIAAALTVPERVLPFSVASARIGSRPE